MWNPLPKTGLCGFHCPNWVWCYLPWRTHPISHCLSSSLKDKPWVALTFILLRICFVGGGWSPSWKKKRLHVKNGKVQDGIHCPNWVWYYLSWRMPEKFLFHTVDTKSMWMTVLKFQNFFFHSIFAFYMNSILVILKTQKLPFCFLTILVDLNVVLFGIFFDISKCEIPQKSIWKASKIVEMAVYDLLLSAKIDFT